MYFLGALINFANFSVTVKALNFIFGHVTVAAQHLDGVLCDGVGRLRGEEYRLICQDSR